MTDESRGMSGAVGPPWSVDVLADLHAGVLSEPEAAALWPQVNADPDARSVIDALDATAADLATLTEGPFEPMPAQFAARLDAALAREAGAPSEAPAPVVSLADARKRRNKRLGWGVGVLVAAAAAVTVIALPGGTGTSGPPAVALPPTSASGVPGVPAVGSDGTGAESLFGQALGVRNFGPLGDEQHLDACLSANGFDPAVRPAGVQPITVAGQSGVMVVLTTGKLAQYRLVAFPANCGPDHPGKLFDKLVGEK
jgi:hypothetical protein